MPVGTIFKAKRATPRNPRPASARGECVGCGMPARHLEHRRFAIPETAKAGIVPAFAVVV